MPNNKQRGEDALNHLNRELKNRDRKEKARPLGVVAASVVVILALVGGIWFMSTRDTSNEEVTASDQSSTDVSPTEQSEAKVLTGQRAQALPATVTCTYEEQKGQDTHGATVPEGKNISTSGTVKVSFKTAQGEIAMDLDRAVAPCTVNAIAHLAKSGYYDNTVCHRETSGMLNVLQCGDPTGKGSGGPGFQFANEYPTDELGDAAATSQVTYPKGSIAMANAGAGTNGSQFFLNYADSTLPGNYTYFGKVTDEGQATLDKIAAAGIKDGETDGAPAEEVKIASATVSS